MEAELRFPTIFRSFATEFRNFIRLESFVAEFRNFATRLKLKSIKKKRC